MSKQGTLLFTSCVFTVVIILLTLLLEPAHAKKPPKTYPEEGKITGTGTLEHQVGFYSHTYTIATSSKVLWLDCPHRGNLFQHVGGECGGTKPMQVGDIVHFRVENGWVYVVVIRDIYNDKKAELVPTEVEEKLRILNEQLMQESSDNAQPGVSGKAPVDAKAEEPSVRK